MTSLHPPSLGSPMVEDEENVENSNLTENNYDNNYNNNIIRNINSTDDTSLEKSELLEPPLFSKEQRVFAKDGGEDELLYQAVIKKAARLQGSWKYLVHYQGWNSRWDRWIDEADIVPVSQEAQSRFEAQQQLQQQQIQQQATDSNNKSARKRKTSESLGRKRKETYYYADYCELPFTLKAVLMEECEKLTRRPIGQNQTVVRAVHNLPSTVPARKVIDHFVQRKLKAIAKQRKLLLVSSSDNNTNDNDKIENTKIKLTAEAVETFGKDLIQLFQHALPKLLLYPQERPQYDLFMKESENQQTKDPDDRIQLVDIYGCEYLLRLVVRLPVLLQPLGSGEENETTGQLIADLLVLMQKNRSTLFPGNYRAPRPDEWTAAERAIQTTRNSTS